MSGKAQPKKRGPKPKGPGKSKNLSFSHKKAQKKKKKEDSTSSSTEDASTVTAANVNVNEHHDAQQGKEKEDDDVMVQIGLEETTLDDYLKSMEKPLITESGRRQAIAYVFDNKYKCAENNEDTPWDWDGGIIPSLKRDMGIHQITDIRYILEEALQCKRNGLKYSGTRR